MVLRDSNVGLIDFTIDGMIFQAIEGMTWGEWVNSEYNTGGFSVFFDGSIMKDWESVGTESDYVYDTDVIQAGYTYFLIV